MDQKTFQSLLKYYLSCMDAEEATHLKLRKNQENKTHIVSHNNQEESLFSKDLSQLELSITDERQINFIKRKAPGSETLIDLYYGFPVFVDNKDMISPLFYTEVEAKFSDNDILVILPQIKSFSVNRMHFIKQYGAEETQRICEELEGEFGSFDARIKAAGKYIPSLVEKAEKWQMKPILFRTNLNSSSSGLRYDLTQLLKDENAHTKDTALKYFTNPKANIKQENTIQTIKPSILEIGLLNAQQEEAVAKGLVEPFSVVTGPPGTGKTQVVTALLASAVYNNETVLFASNNNMPVDGVYERLGQSTGDAGNWLMRLGNRKKREACNKTIYSLLERVETSDIASLSLDEEKEELGNLESNIAEARASLKKARLLQDEISKLHSKEKIIEQKLPENWVGQFVDTDPIALDQACLKNLKRHSHLGFWLWVRRKLFGLEKYTSKHNALLTVLCGDNQHLSEYESWLLFDEPWDESISKAHETLTHLELHESWVSCIKKRRRLELKISQYSSVSDVFDLKVQKSKVSQTLFEKNWFKNIHNTIKDATEAFNSYFQDIDDFSAGRHRRLEKSLKTLSNFFPIWITTNQSTSAIMPPQVALFDLVVIDEAGQCNIPSIMPLLYRAKRAVIIGDPHQFKHIASLKDDIEHAISQEIGLEEIVDEWSFKRRSAFDRSFISTKSTSFLKQHYRCHPDIIEFSNLNFYDGKLVEQVGLSQFQNKLPIEENGLIWHNTPGETLKANKGAWNPTEIEKTAQIFDRWSQEGLFADPNISYGIVTPFRKQVTEMHKTLSEFPWFKSVENRFTIGTAHSFQGSECDVLVYSPVISEGMEEYLVKFAAAQKDLINVTVTRAKNLLYIVGDLHVCQAASPDTPLYQLATYAERIRKQQQHPMNSAEKAMAEILEELKLSYIPQYILGQYRLDFMLNSSAGERYNIEVDGDIHLTAEAIKHDERRDAYVEGKGVKILRFAARDVVHKRELIKERLMRI